MNAPRHIYAAFTLLEVMMAAAIFFMGMFALLGVLSSGLHAASILQKNSPTAAMALAESTLFKTNSLEEVGQSGNFGALYPDYQWELQPHEILTNGFFQVDVAVYHNRQLYSTMSILLYRPDSTQHR
jgi:Tfp pilus assembly protein PilV